MHQRWLANWHKSFWDAWLIKSVSTSSAHLGEEGEENKDLQETNFLLPQPRCIESISWTLLYFTCTNESEYGARVCWGSTPTTRIHSYSRSHKHSRHHQVTFDICFLEWLTPPPTDRTNKLHLELPIGGLKTQPSIFVSKPSFHHPTINCNLSRIWGTSKSVYKIYLMAFWDFCPLGENGEATDNQAASNLTWDVSLLWTQLPSDPGKHIYTVAFFTNGGFTVYAFSWCPNLNLHHLVVLKCKKTPVWGHAIKCWRELAQQPAAGEKS